MSSPLRAIALCFLPSGLYPLPRAYALPPPLPRPLPREGGGEPKSLSPCGRGVGVFMKDTMQKTSHLTGLLTALALAALLAGCGTRAPRKAAPPTAKPAPQQQPHAPITQTPKGHNNAPRGGVCNAQPAQSAIGKKATGDILEQARVRAGARMARVLHPNQAVTLELNAERLNVRVDGKGTIVAVDCG